MTDSGAISDRSLWETHAGWWQDAFTEGADAEYTEQIVPLVAEHLAGATSVLDVGTGEGQLARVAVGTGGRVVGVDPSWGQLTEAVRRGGGPVYLRAEAVSLPFPDGVFDAALACLVFEHIEGVDEAIAEVGRVVRPGGRFLFLLNHPLLQVPGSGWIDDHILDEQYWRIGPYLVEDISLEEVDKDVFLPFVHRPLSRYVNAMASAGLFITRMEEPAPPARLPGSRRGVHRGDDDSPSAFSASREAGRHDRGLVVVPRYPGLVCFGWADVARQSDLTALRGEMAELRAEIKSQLPRLYAANIASMIGVAGLVLAAAKLA